MSTSAQNNKQRKSIFKTGFVYLLFALLCGIFAAVYEHFGHGVYSWFMIFAFGFPLIGGAVPMFVFAFASRRYFPKSGALQLYHASIATFTVGSLFTGVLEIYGTTNQLVCIYWYTGAILFGLAVLWELVSGLVQGEK